MIQEKRTFSCKRKNYIITHTNQVGVYAAIVKDLDQHGQCFGNLSRKFPGISKVKLKVIT